jgi:hypothetical protein
MNNQTGPGFLRTALVVVAAASLAACATMPGQTEEPAAPEPVVIEFERWEGDPMDMPIDGSSPEAFERTLARYKDCATTEQYQGLLDAIDYLLVYDIGAHRDRDKLAARLDGLTVAEVYERVSWARQGPPKEPEPKESSNDDIIHS